MPTAADILIDTLIDWRVKVVFGLPGDGINGITQAPGHERIEAASVEEPLKTMIEAGNPDD